MIWSTLRVATNIKPDFCLRVAVTVCSTAGMGVARQQRASSPVNDRRAPAHPGAYILLKVQDNKSDVISGIERWSIIYV